MPSAIMPFRLQRRAVGNDAQQNEDRKQPGGSLPHGLYTPERELIVAENWGLCESCKWWQVEPDASIAAATMGLCIEEQLQPYQLRVSGKSGCNVFKKGTPARAAGSSETPPTAEPQR
jgi:hypothetical protein